MKKTRCSRARVRPPSVPLTKSSMKLACLRAVPTKKTKAAATNERVERLPIAQSKDRELLGTVLHVYIERVPTDFFFNLFFLFGFFGGRFDRGRATTRFPCFFTALLFCTHSFIHWFKIDVKSPYYGTCPRSEWGVPE